MGTIKNVHLMLDRQFEFAFYTGRIENVDIFQIERRNFKALSIFRQL